MSGKFLVVAVVEIFVCIFGYRDIHIVSDKNNMFLKIFLFEIFKKNRMKSVDLL